MAPVPVIQKALTVSGPQASQLCALAAVGCLASALVHWSNRYPSENPASEQLLFGELAVDDSATRPGRTFDAAPLPVTNEPFPTIGERLCRGATDVRPILPELHCETASSPVVTGSRFSEPPDADVHSLRTVAHHSRPGTAAVWLCGEIEVVADETEAVTSTDISFTRPLPASQ